MRRRFDPFFQHRYRGMHVPFTASPLPAFAIIVLSRQAGACRLIS
jgi:hypothetical protein